MFDKEFDENDAFNNDEYMTDAENDAMLDRLEQDEITQQDYEENIFPSFKEYDKNKYNEGKKMKKQLIRMTEGDLHRIIAESVNQVLKEWDGDDEFYGWSDHLEGDEMTAHMYYNLDTKEGVPSLEAAQSDGLWVGLEIKSADESLEYLDITEVTDYFEIFNGEMDSDIEEPEISEEDKEDIFETAKNLNLFS